MPPPAQGAKSPKLIYPPSSLCPWKGRSAEPKSFAPETGHSRRKQVIRARNKSSAPETSHSRRKQVIHAGNKSFTAETSHSRRKQVIHGGNKSSSPSRASGPDWPIYRKQVQFMLPRVSNSELKPTGRTGANSGGRMRPPELDGATPGENP
jgi:hypothetical protein